MSSEKKSSSGYVLSVDEKRQVLYASLLRFEPMADALRDTVLERVVLSGLQV